jgi:glycosyltransferase involved in cell wall biosynthesis
MSDTVGGGYTYQKSLIEAIRKANSEHCFFIYYSSGEDLFSNSKNVSFFNFSTNLRAQKVAKNFWKEEMRYVSISLEEVSQKDGVELMFFMAHQYEEITSPFVFLIMDLGHRILPFFPELRHAGWQWNDRESFYKAAQKASYVLTGNSEGQRQVEHFLSIDPSKIRIIPLPTPEWMHQTEEDYSIMDEYDLMPRQFIFYPAQFWPHKNHIRILQSLVILKKKGKNFQVVFSGSDKGNKSYILECIKASDLDNCVKFTGFVDGNKMKALYKYAFCMVFPSFLGPDNLPPLEAMALDCPVIAAANTGMENQLGNAALFFDPCNAEELADRILQLQDEAARTQLLASGRLLASDRSADNYMGSIIKIIDEFKAIRECWGSEYIHL